MKKKIIKLLALALWILLIFYLSNQTGFTSSKQSDGLVKFTNNLIGIDKSILVVIIRKFAHIFEYLVLFILLYINFSEYITKHIYLYSFIFSVMYAVFDEIHQTFIYERSGSITDIIIDILGIFLGLVTVKLYNNFINKHKKTI